MSRKNIYIKKEVHMQQPTILLKYYIASEDIILYGNNKE